MQSMQQDSLILNSLNEAQRAAITAPADHLLILAGAGSGKTRVLVHRIAWLVQHENISPERIFAVTFTNKAAQQMLGRVEALLNTPSSHLWIGTFHGIAHRLLRRHWSEAGLLQAFQVIDSDDQYRLIRRVMKNLNLDETRWPPKQAQWFINAQKEEGLRPEQTPVDGDIFSETNRRIYQDYEQICRGAGLVDFAELLLRTYEMLSQNNELLTYYQQRFQHILVDEFQDTNQLQYRWLKLLAGATGKMMMVGDDDQSIYSWRGAKVEHLQCFIKDYPKVQIIRLEQNYRSTGVILAAANSVIAHNRHRLGKDLWTQERVGEKITLYAGFNDRDEAHFIANQILYWLENGGCRREVAILYRSNAQSRVLEEVFIQVGLPYRIYGGLRFFERAEVKDALAYLRLIANPQDDAAFERVVNLPTRGVGDNTLAALREYARQHRISLWESVATLLLEGGLATRAAAAIRGFVQLIQDLIQTTAQMTLPEQTSYVIEKSGLLHHYRQDRSEKGKARVENLEELLNATHQFTPHAAQGSYRDDASVISELVEFLSQVSLEAGDHQADDYADCVHLMTLHSAKGLEFPLVFLTGMEENLFPHAMSAQDPQQLEEERRLCYVGMTRAMSKLCLTYAENRFLHGKEMRQRPSRFLKEIPPEHISDAYTRVKMTVKDPMITAGLGMSLGQRVRHAHFGEGVVLNSEGSGDHARVQVRFAAGAKWLVASYAKLEMI